MCVFIVLCFDNKLILSVGTKRRSWKDASTHLYSLRARPITSLFPTLWNSLSLRIITRVRSLVGGLPYSDILLVKVDAYSPVNNSNLGSLHHGSDVERGDRIVQEMTGETIYRLVI